MNILPGQIENVIHSGSLSLVYIKVQNTRISSIIIDTPISAPYLKTGNNINVIFKETEVIIGKGFTHQISMQNKFTGTILTIESKDLLSKLTIDTTVGRISSIITTNAVKQLELNEGTEVTAMVKTNEIILSE
jgi:molybdate transport system regulatory protein